MTSVAAKLLEEFERLAPDEQLLIRQRVIRLPEQTQREALQRLRGSSAGKPLLSKLLADRSQERLRG